MLSVLLVLFLAVPLLELAVIAQVQSAIGLPETLVLLVVDSVVGAALVRRQGLTTLRRARARLDQGRVPGREVVDGVLILLAGALMLTPGFVTDAVGFSMLLPPVRALVRAAAVRRFGARVTARVGVAGPADAWHTDVWDVEGSEVDPAAGPGDAGGGRRGRERGWPDGDHPGLP